MAITIAFDAEPHPLPVYDDGAIAPERRLHCGAKGAIGDPQRGAGIDAP
jgi:hypothetical protein